MTIFNMAGVITALLLMAATPSLAVVHSEQPSANPSSDTATLESIEQELQSKQPMGELQFRIRKQRLIHDFQKGLTPKNHQQRMAELTTALDRLNQEKKAADEWRAAKMKTYWDELAKLTPEARGTWLTDSLGLTFLNVNRRLFPQLGPVLSFKEWQAFSPEQKKALETKAKERLEALGRKN